MKTGIGKNMQGKRVVIQLLLLAGILFSSLASAAPVVITTPLTLAADDISYEGTDLVIDGVVATIAGTHRFNSLQLINGATITHEHAVADKLVLEVAGELLVSADSKIDVTGKGNVEAVGMSASAGGSYGGSGGVYSGQSTNAVYGDFLAPVDYGTGNAYEFGGGAINIQAGSLRLDGQIVANGGDESADVLAGGASGGSILLNIGELSGSGSIAANGSNGNSHLETGGGGGGRVTIYYNSLNGFDMNSVIVEGGAGTALGGGKGSVYLGKPSPNQGYLINLFATSGIANPGANDINKITLASWIENYGETAHLAVTKATTGGVDITHTGIVDWFDPSRSLYFEADERYWSTDYAQTTIDYLDGNGGIVFWTRTFSYSSYGTNLLYGTSQDHSGGVNPGHVRSHPMVNGVLEFDSTAKVVSFNHVEVDPSIYNYGQVNSWELTDIDVDSIKQIRLTESLVRSKYNGGRAFVRLKLLPEPATRIEHVEIGRGLTDHFTVAFSVAIDSQSFGTEDIQLLDAQSSPISISAITPLDSQRFRVDLAAPLAEGSYSLRVGPNILSVSGKGMDQDADGFEQEADDIYDHGTFDVIEYVEITSDITISATSTEFDNQKILIDGATITVEGPHPFKRLELVNGAKLSTPVAINSYSPKTSIVVDDLIIDSTSSIDVSGKGMPNDPAAGNATGGSYGGLGGQGGNYGNGPANDVYGDYKQPFEFGTGGRYYSGVNNGTRGGGAIKLVVSGRLQLDGSITAIGSRGSYYGGGSGGAVWIDAGTLAGVGTISARGADGWSNSSGGGGGRVAIYY
ncbi:MAG: hypothetical protein V7629_02685, partial [Motiliproteus sp.]